MGSWLTNKVRSMADVFCQRGGLHHNVGHSDGSLWTFLRCCWHHLSMWSQTDEMHLWDPEFREEPGLLLWKKGMSF